MNELKNSTAPIFAVSAFAALARLADVEIPYETELRAWIHLYYWDEGCFSSHINQRLGPTHTELVGALTDTYHASFVLGDHITDQQREQITAFLMMQVEEAEKQIRGTKLSTCFTILTTADNFGLGIASTGRGWKRR